ncbi:MAG: hypothetical protein KJ893_06645 [Candidatus Omnitrophica bacterium]|nr:hypothetical protein [Candidatus Omnitrophota bacterium]MBU4479458.1 hypothetical protein [Candidatus Omnitrophota bacterium]
MDNITKKREERKRERWDLILFIILLIAIFIAWVIIDKKFPEQIRSRKYNDKYESDVKTYDGSLHRNLANPLGSE